RLLRSLQDVRPAEGGADLLVGIADVGDRLEFIEAEGQQAAHGVEAEQKPALHVRDARPERPVSLGPKRPLRRRTRGEHGVHVADEWHAMAPLAGAASAMQLRDQEIAETRLARLG